jgi:cobalt-zinc-cadmium efflux system membrane fusion protein
MKQHYLIYLLVFLIFGCSTDDEPITIDSVSEGGSEEITLLTKEQFEAQDMTLDSLSVRQFSGTIHCTGVIDIPPEFKADVSSYFGGYVKNIQLVSGTFVKKGQTLFHLENPDFVDLQREFLEKKNELALLKTEYERQTQLAKSNATSNKELNSAKSAYEIAVVSKSSLEQKLKLMNINPDKLSAEKIRSTITVQSPITGYVTAVNITKGMFLDPHQVAVSIEGVDHKHMELNVYEKDLANIHVGDQIRMMTASDPAKYYIGEVYLIDKSIHPENRTVKVHGHFQEDAENLQALLPEMYIEAEINTNSKSANSLPESAVVSTEDGYYVLMLTKQTESTYEFVKTRVVVGETSDGFIAIKNAAELPKNSLYLSKGVFQLIQ